MNKDKLKEELTNIVGQVADYYLNRQGLMVTSAVTEIEKFINQNYISKQQILNLECLKEEKDSIVYEVEVDTRNQLRNKIKSEIEKL